MNQYLKTSLVLSLFIFTFMYWITVSRAQEIVRYLRLQTGPSQYAGKTLPQTNNGLKIELLKASQSAQLRANDSYILTIVLTNCSKTPLRVWSGGSWAYDTTKFEVIDLQGELQLLIPHGVSWAQNFPVVIELAPGESRTENSAVSLPKKPQQFKVVRAIYDVPQDSESKEYKVWTGVIASPYHQW